jgi:hypothetical protein
MRSKFKQAPITGLYKIQVGKDFIPLSSFSYCTEAQMTGGTCCENSLSKDYVLQLAATIKQDDFTYAILKNDKLKQIVITLTGTKKNIQLVKEAWYSNTVLLGDASKKMFISEYFFTVFTQAKVKIKPTLVDLNKRFPGYQNIFTGHSLGAAMATIFALDSVLDGYVTKTDSSPALINYASPRVGNYIFASQVMLNVPVIYRLVRDGDPVVSIPPCSYITRCSNKLGLENFTGRLADVTGPTIPEDKGYWHIAGLILYDNSMTTFTDCGRVWSENNTDAKCVTSPTLSVDSHTYYLTKSVSGVCQGARKYLFSKKVLKQFKN